MMTTRLEEQYPWLEDRSAWREFLRHGVTPADPAGVGHGARVLGNGHIFAMGHGAPFTRLTAILGPDYGRDAEFAGWGEQILVLQHADQEVHWETQEAFRVRRTAIIGAELHAPGLRMLVVDCIPPDWPVLLRTVELVNTGTAPLRDLRLDVRHADLPAIPQALEPDGLLVTCGARRLQVTALDGPALPHDTELRILVPTVQPGDSIMLRIALITGRDPVEMGALVEKVRRDADGLLGATYHAWQHWMRDTLLLAGDDVRLADLMDDGKVLVAVQQGAGGVIAPLAERSTATAVDEDAPLRWLLLQGKYAEVRRALSARYAETCRRGVYAKRLPADLPERAEVAEPEWTRLQPPPAWTAGVIVRLHGDYWRQTGDRDLVARHYAYLRWMIEGQTLSHHGLVACGGDEPFYSAFQYRLPAEMRETLLPDAAGYSAMRPAPWSAASAMALVGAAESLSVIAQQLGELDDAHRLGALAARIRDSVEQTYWRDDDGYYAAAKSRVDGRLFRTPHLPTALAPYLTGYAQGNGEHARRGLDEVLQYCLSETGLPQTTPDVAAFPGALAGELLATLTQLAAQHRDLLYLGVRSLASPAGEFRAVYTPVTMSAITARLADPSVTAATLCALVTYLLTAGDSGDIMELAPHLPPGQTHLHMTGVRVAGRRVEVDARRTDDGDHIHVGNSGPGVLHLRLRHHGLEASPVYALNPGEHLERMMPHAITDAGLEPVPRVFVPALLTLPAAPLLILTVDGEGFGDWREQYGAQLLDPSFPLLPRDFARLLLDDAGHRRYDAIYLDVPESGAAWAGLPMSFWQHEALTTALDRFRDTGGVVTGTLFLDRWQVAIDGRYLGTLAARHGWLALMPEAQIAFAEAVFPWESTAPEEVTLLLYLADSCELDLAVNGEVIWRSDRREGRRAAIPVVMNPDENRVTIHARHHENGFAFSLGIRMPVRWNSIRGARDQAA